MAAIAVSLKYTSYFLMFLFIQNTDCVLPVFPLAAIAVSLKYVLCYLMFILGQYTDCLEPIFPVAAIISREYFYFTCFSFVNPCSSG